MSPRYKDAKAHGPEGHDVANIVPASTTVAHLVSPLSDKEARCFTLTAGTFDPSIILHLDAEISVEQPPFTHEATQ
jgi:hypothetical protein